MINYIASAYNHRTKEAFIFKIEANGIREARKKAWTKDIDITIFSGSVMTEKEYNIRLKEARQEQEGE